MPSEVDWEGWCCGWCCFHVILLILWLPLLLCGCDPDLALGGLECPIREIHHGNLTEVEVTENVCCQWIGIDLDQTCKNKDYSCCTADLTYTFPGERGYCTDSYGPVHNCSSIQLGVEKTFAWDPNTGTCAPLTRAKRIAISGICFLALDILLYLCCFCSCYAEKKAEEGELRWTLLPHEAWHLQRT